MVLIRFGVLAVFLVMLLPTGPAGTHTSGPGADGDFCDRYPHTCRAGVELFTAFKLKLAYGITLARASLGSPSTTSGYLDRPADARKINGRLGDEWQPADDRRDNPTYAGNTAGRDRPSPEWRRD